jgi:hypothetical protein
MPARSAAQSSPTDGRGRVTQNAKNADAFSYATARQNAGPALSASEKRQQRAPQRSEHERHDPTKPRPSVKHQPRHIRQASAEAGHLHLPDDLQPGFSALATFRRARVPALSERMARPACDCRGGARGRTTVVSLGRAVLFEGRPQRRRARAAGQVSTPPPPRPCGGSSPHEGVSAPASDCQRALTLSGDQVFGLAGWAVLHRVSRHLTLDRATRGWSGWPRQHANVGAERARSIEAWRHRRAVRACDGGTGPVRAAPVAHSGAGKSERGTDPGRS